MLKAGSKARSYSNRAGSKTKRRLRNRKRNWRKAFKVEMCHRTFSSFIKTGSLETSASDNWLREVSWVKQKQKGLETSTYPKASFLKCFKVVSPSSGWTPCNEVKNGRLPKGENCVPSLVFSAHGAQSVETFLTSVKQHLCSTLTMLSG